MGIFDTAASLQWGTSAYRGADYTRLSADRWRSVNHPDTEIQHALKPLRAASRDLFRNNPYAQGIGDAIADNVTGWEGIRCKPVVRDATGELIREVNWSIESAWAEWAAEYATVDGVEGLLETERLIDRSWAMDGEVFVRRHRGFDNPHGYAVELIDPDLLDEEFNESRSRTGREIVMGVEIDKYGRPLAYHFWTEHPDEIGFRRQRVRVPADEVAHWFIRQRPGQTRGYPLLTPALTRFEMVDGYEEAELVAARAGASKMGFIENTNADAAALHAQRKMMQAEQGKGDVRIRRKMAVATIDELDPGQQFVGFDPTHPSDAFDTFVKTILRGIARTAGMSYLTMTGDVGEANYSSMRAGLLPERDHWKVLQAVKSRRIHRHVYADWLPMARLTGALVLPSRPSSAYRAVEFRGRRWQWVDPAKDLDAAEREVKLGVNSRQRVASDRGLDYETIIDESAEDMAYARDASVYVGGVSTPPAARSGEPSGNGTNGNGNGSRVSSRLAPYGETT